MESEYKITEYTYRFLKEAEKIFSSGPRSGENRPERASKGRKVSNKEEYFLESIRKDTVHRKESIKEIVLKCSDTSFKIYSDEFKRLSWENSKLREELRKANHMKDRKGNEEKKQERIISQKNEQIRKISQELEKTSSELKKVKIGNNKQDDRQKKGKKSSRSTNRKKRELILEIPLLPEISQDEPGFTDARDIFFYDIPKYWSEEDVRTNLMKIGKVVRIQIRSQYKYKTVKAKILLNENFKKSFEEGHFGICISKNFIRWYDASLGLKERQERDKWQTVRDLTNEEMESIKNGSSYDFIKQLQQNLKSEFLKIIKITKNWKVIGYFKNQKAMEEAVEDSCTTGNIKEVWLIRNKKTIYRDTSKEEEKKKICVKENSKSIASSLSNLKENATTPMTPPDRVYSELGNFASRNYDFFGTSSIRNAKKPDFSGKKITESKFLKKDNIAPEEVVGIIRDYRAELHKKAKSCVKLKENSSPVAIATKMKEWEKIYKDTGNEMEWEAINLVAIEEKQEEENLGGQEEVNQWLAKQDNMSAMRRRVIELAEEQNNFEKYTTLNDDFTKRLEDVNRHQDEKEAGDKRPILESPSAPVRKPCLVDVNENSDDEDESEDETVKEESGSIIELEKEESSTKAQETMSKTQKKKWRKRNDRKKR
ncbi:hypothetical protein RhiirA4_527513 [Rhizophagus irregularis]|uniref:Uncharacterized protein n=1 Tax=Rhizophagus irregularis TaxID=588596 RepID=A0A2I1GRW2_9GLOM|nr:hypothetical protein RhiirA4_527513 [Rhizophagus irregularis]